MTLARGSIVGGRYHVIATIAKGGMGAVYEAFDERLQRSVALKVLLAELGEDRESIARFEREAVAAARLAHPSIVAIHDFGTEPSGARFLVMEKVLGSTLAQILGSEGKLAPARAADIAVQALGALAHAHASGVVHRDLKPGNLMIVTHEGGKELVVVLDFGLAQLKTSTGYARLTQTGAILGTPIFMAPEQARGEDADERTDVYAMGVLLWCLLTGKPPFAGGDMRDVVMQVLREHPKRADALVPTVPAALADVVATAMEKEPGRRFASARAFANAITAAMTTGVRLPGAEAASARTVTAKGARVASSRAPSRGAASPAPRPRGAASAGRGKARGAVLIVLVLVGAIVLGGGGVVALLVVPRLLAQSSPLPPIAAPLEGPAPEPFAPSFTPGEACLIAMRCCDHVAITLSNQQAGDCNRFTLPPSEYADEVCIASCDESRQALERAEQPLGPCEESQ